MLVAPDVVFGEDDHNYDKNDGVEEDDEKY